MSELKAVALKEELSKETKEVAKTIQIKLIDLANIQVFFTGKWNGKLIKGVIRQLEKEYKKIKAVAMRECIAKEQKEQNEQKLKAEATTKGA